MTVPTLFASPSWKNTSSTPTSLKVVGNGWDNPLPGNTDPGNAEHNKKNRRVEVKVFPLESN